MTEIERKLLEGCGALLERWVEVVGPNDAAVPLIRKIRSGAEPAPADLEEMRACVMRLAELSQALPPIGHASGDRKERLDALLRAVPAGWFQREEREGDEVWLVNGMAPLAIPELMWVYLETCQGQLLREESTPSE